MLRKHPKGLAVIFFTRLGAGGLLYPDGHPGPYMDKVLGWSDSRKGDYYGIFLGCAISCRFWRLDRRSDSRPDPDGPDRAALMAVAMSARPVVAEPNNLVLSRPAPHCRGTGIFKVNMAVMVGNLYADRPQLKDAGFNIFYMGVNIGAAIAPLIATAVSAIWGSYNISFWICAAGLVCALIIFQVGKPRLGPRGQPLVDRRGGIDGGEARTSACRPDERRRGPKPCFHPHHVGHHRHFLLDPLLSELFRPDPLPPSDGAEPSNSSAETYQFFEPFFIIVLDPILSHYSPG